MPNDMSPEGTAGRFEITRFFEGRTTANGVFEDRSGRLRRRFRATFVGGWADDGLFVIDEDFLYDDGIHEKRQWRIRRLAGGRFTATCGECIGEADGITGDQDWRMTYKFRLRLAKRSIVVAFDERMYRVDAGVAINRATVRKWGVRLGEVTIVFRKTGDAAFRRADEAALVAA
jgi:hypothetical protein